MARKEGILPIQGKKDSSTIYYNIFLPLAVPILIHFKEKMATDISVREDGRDS